MAKRITTLFIEDAAIRFLIARGRQTEKWASVALDPGIVQHGMVQDKEKLAEKIKETFQWAGAGNKVMLGLSEPGSLYRIITLPKLPEAILAEAVKREAERVIPLPQDEIYLAYQIISTHTDDMQIFLAAFSRNAVDTLVSTLQMAGIKPTSLDLVPLSLCRAVDKGTAIVVSLRSSNFEIAIMVDKVPQVIRSLSLPGEAESMADKLPTIAEELDRTISFYNSSHTDSPLDNNIPVFVDGELAQVPDSWPSLTGSLGSTVTPISSIMQTTEEFDSNQFTVNIGLALKEDSRDVSGTIINFNALPKSYLPEKPKLSRITIPIGAGVGVIILAFIALQANSVKSNVNMINSEIASTQAITAQVNKNTSAIKDQIKTVQAEAQPLQNQIDTATADAATIEKVADSLDSQRSTVDTDISKIISLIPGNMNVTSISLGDNITIKGSAVEPDITLFAKNLAGSNSFGPVLVKSITLNDKNNTGFYDFEIDVALK